MKDTKNHIIWLSYAGILFLVVLSILALTAIFVIRDKSKNDNHTITVSGSAEVLGTPDIAEFSFTVTETAVTTAEAQEVISRKVDEILAALHALGIPEKDIHTQSYTMYPKYEWGTSSSRMQEIAVDGTVYYPEIGTRRQIQVGFDVSQGISVKVRDFDLAPEVLTTLGTVGVQNLYGPNFRIDDPESLQEEARSQAIQQAQEKARRLARDLGVRLDDLISFQEGGYYPMLRQAAGSAMMMDMAVSESAPSPNLPVGESTISSQVTLVYTIK